MKMPLVFFLLMSAGGFPAEAALEGGGGVRFRVRPRFAQPQCAHGLHPLFRIELLGEGFTDSQIDTALTNACRYIEGDNPEKWMKT